MASETERASEEIDVESPSPPSGLRVCMADGSLRAIPSSQVHRRITAQVDGRWQVATRGMGKGEGEKSENRQVGQVTPHDRASFASSF